MQYIRTPKIFNIVMHHNSKIHNKNYCIKLHNTRKNK